MAHGTDFKGARIFFSYIWHHFQEYETGKCLSPIQYLFKISIELYFIISVLIKLSNITESWPNILGFLLFNILFVIVCFVLLHLVICM